MEVGMCQVMQEFTAEEVVGNDRFHTDLFRFYIKALFVPGGVVLPRRDLPYVERWWIGHAARLLLSDVPARCAAQVATGTYLPGALWVYEATKGFDLSKLAPDVHVWAEFNPLTEEKPGCAKKLCPSAQQAADEKQRVKNIMMGTLAADITGHFRADIEATRAAIMAPDEEIPGFGNVKSYLKAISRKSKKVKSALKKAIKSPWSR